MKSSSGYGQYVGTVFASHRTPKPKGRPSASFSLPINEVTALATVVRAVRADTQTRVAPYEATPASLVKVMSKARLGRVSPPLAQLTSSLKAHRSIKYSSMKVTDTVPPGPRRISSRLTPEKGDGSAVKISLWLFRNSKSMSSPAFFLRSSSVSHGDNVFALRVLARAGDGSLVALLAANAVAAAFFDLAAAFLSFSSSLSLSLLLCFFLDFVVVAVGMFPDILRGRNELF